MRWQRKEDGRRRELAEGVRWQRKEDGRGSEVAEDRGGKKERKTAQDRITVERRHGQTLTEKTRHKKRHLAKAGPTEHLSKRWNS